MLFSPFRASYSRGMIDKNSYSLEIVTRSYPVRAFIYDLFYVDGVKCISLELFHYLSPQAIAYCLLNYV